MGKKEYFVYDKIGLYDNPLKVMKGLPIAKEASDVGYDIVCGAVAKEKIDTFYTLMFGGIYPAEEHISKGARGIILCDDFGISDIPEQAYVPLLLRRNIKFVELSQFAGRFSYSSMFEDFPVKWDGIEYEPPGVNSSKYQVDYVASETAKLHCPAENIAGNTTYKILEAKEHIDTDGSILGVVLAKSEHQYVTWDYTYLPRSKFFNGFNNGHYYDSDSAASAIHDFDKRCKERFGRAIGNVDEEAKDIAEDEGEAPILQRAR